MIPFGSPGFDSVSKRTLADSDDHQGSFANFRMACDDLLIRGEEGAARTLVAGVGSTGPGGTVRDMGSAAGAGGIPVPDVGMTSSQPGRIQ